MHKEIFEWNDFFYQSQWLYCIPFSFIISILFSIVSNIYLKGLRYYDTVNDLLEEVTLSFSLIMSLIMFVSFVIALIQYYEYHNFRTEILQDGLIRIVESIFLIAGIIVLMCYFIDIITSNDEISIETFIFPIITIIFLFIIFGALVQGIVIIGFIFSLLYMGYKWIIEIIDTFAIKIIWNINASIFVCLLAIFTLVKNDSHYVRWYWLAILFGIMIILKIVDSMIYKKTIQDNMDIDLTE